MLEDYRGISLAMENMSSREPSIVQHGLELIVVICRQPLQGEAAGCPPSLMIWQKPMMTCNGCWGMLTCPGWGMRRLPLTRLLVVGFPSGQDAAGLTAACHVVIKELRARYGDRATEDKPDTLRSLAMSACAALAK